MPARAVGARANPAADAVQLLAARPSPALRVLLQAVVDYAGLFPPASLSMTSAAAEYARHRDGPHMWALGRFVLPAARLEEFEDAAASALPRESARCWVLSALLGSDLEQDVDRVDAFNERHRDVRAGAVIVDTVELRAHSPRDVERAGELLDRRFDTYVEIPASDDPAELIDAIARAGAKAKLRTGGVTADAFPTSAQLVRFIKRSVGHGVSFKATAGLHHPWRNEYRLTYAPDAPSGTMFGFLNLLLATAGLHAGLPDADVEALLEERDPTAASFAGDGVLWRGRILPMAALVKARDSMITFGSCSFSDPVDALRAGALL